MDRGYGVEAVSRVVVDWDGTLAEESWPKVGDWLPGAVDALKALARNYDEVYIWSCRFAEVEVDEVTPRSNEDQVDLINKMLWKAAMPHNVRLWTRTFKPRADFYIDDRALRFEGDWLAVLEEDQPTFDTGASIRTGSPIREFASGATRDTDAGKYDYEGFLSPLVLRRFAAYMDSHRVQSDGKLRSSDNWQKGIPLDAYMKSGWRHFMDWWMMHRQPQYSHPEDPELEDALCALLFNVQGYLHELLKEEA